jgi:hypothetical protein
MKDDPQARGGLPQKAFANADDQIRERTDRFRQVYANNFRFNLNSWDIGMTFGEITGERDGRAVIEETAKVTMTREMAKVLSIILHNHIEAFEAQYGEIRIPISDEAEAAEEAETIPEVSREEDARAKDDEVPKVKPTPVSKK